MTTAGRYPDILAALAGDEVMKKREAFAAAADRFWLEMVATGNSLAHPADRVRGLMRAKFADLAADIGMAAYGILDAHAKHYISPGKFGPEFDATGKPIFPPAEELRLGVITRYFGSYIVAFKAFFFFLRAYQDLAWVLLREIVDGVFLTPGIGKGTMGKAFACDTPARGHLIEEVDSYEPWFVDWRDLRNKVKTGVNFGVRIEQNPGVTFLVNRVLPGGGLALGGEGDRIVRMSELTHALEVMTALARAVRTALGQ
jgi:hypothetical protein